MTDRRTTRRGSSPDYQSKADGFTVGQVVSVTGHGVDAGGTVVSVFPSIGMVDVEYPSGTVRHPVEDLQRYDNGGMVETQAVKVASAKRVALYWAARDRQYRATKGELDSGGYTCPKCKIGTLRKTCYKRTEGKSEKLLGCPECLFLVKASAIIGDPSYPVVLQDTGAARLASTGLDCQFYKARDGKWYMDLEQESNNYSDDDDDDGYGDSYPDYNTYGPFSSLKEAQRYLDKNFANPGGWGEDPSGRHPTPKNPINPRTRRWADGRRVRSTWQ